MEHPSFRDVLGDLELAQGVEDLLVVLEAAGWYPRGRRGSTGVCYWPDNGRPRQIVIDTSYPINTHRLNDIRERTGTQVMNREREGARDE
jgi:hypothetical protein